MNSQEKASMSPDLYFLSRPFFGHSVADFISAFTQFNSL